MIIDPTRSEKERFRVLHQYRNIEMSGPISNQEASELLKFIDQLIQKYAPFQEIDFAMASYKALAEKAPLSLKEISRGLKFFEKIRKDPNMDYGIEIRASEILKNLRNQ